MSSDLLSLVRGRRGHFLYESGHHADMWFDLETLCLNPAALAPHITNLSEVVSKYRPEIICGPLVEGAYVALLVAKELGCEFVYANRFQPPSTVDGQPSILFPIQYRIPDSLHSAVRGRRVAICNDMISAGSAVRGAYLHLQELGAEVVVVASLMTCGSGFRDFAAHNNLRVEKLSQFDSNLWTPDSCPLCAQGAPLESLANA